MLEESKSRSGEQRSIDTPFAQVPRHQIQDTSVSRGARFMFLEFCSHAKPNGVMERSLARFAAQEGITKRTAEKWLIELEMAGWVIRLGGVTYRLVRAKSAFGKAQVHNAIAIGERKAKHGPNGKRGAEARKRKREAKLSSRKGESAFAETANGDSPEHSTEHIAEHNRSAKGDANKEARLQEWNEETQREIAMEFGWEFISWPQNIVTELVELKKKRGLTSQAMEYLKLKAQRCT